MKMAQVWKIARSRGIDIYRKKKTELIRDMQVKEGNFPCFGTAQDFCDQRNCLWYEDCVKAQHKTHSAS